MIASGLILENDPDDPPGLLAEWLRARRLEFEVLQVWREAASPEQPTAAALERIDPRGYGWIAALGAEDSANSAEPAWIPAEIELLRRAVAAEVPVLGLCFGGQALARALGGEVVAATEAEIGWLEIRPLAGVGDGIPRGPWAQFHYEVFTVPPAATVLAHSPAGPAAFRQGPNLGLQFHPEADATTVESWLDTEAARGADLTGIDREAVFEIGRACAAPAREAAFELFDHWLSLREDLAA